MSPVKTRRHDATATRRDILDAAHDEFVRVGFHGATVTAIAKRAGVAPQTVYFVFHSKPELISAVIDRAVMGEGELPPQATGWWQQMLEEPDAAAAVRLFVRGAGDAFDRASRISEVLRAAALTDPALRRTSDHHEALRRAGFAEVLDALAHKGELRVDLDRERLLDVFLTVYGDAVHYVFTVEHGWSHDAYLDWVCDTLPGMLLAR